MNSNYLFHPKLLIQKYFESAIRRKIQEQTLRILTVLIIPVWIVAFSISVWDFKDGIIAIPKYIKTKRAFETFMKKNKYNLIVEEDKSFQAFKSIHYDLPQECYEYITNPNTEIYNINQLAVDTHYDRLFKLFSLPKFFIFYILFPWLILYLIFWILNSNNQNSYSDPL